LQQPGATVAGDQVVDLPSEGHRQDKRVVRIERLDTVRKRRQRLQGDDPLQVVDQRADAVRRHVGLELRIAAYTPQLVLVSECLGAYTPYHRPSK
jgi:hypothetical protein